MRKLTEIRLTQPEAIAEAAATRERPGKVAPRQLIIAADHLARGITNAGKSPMTDRLDLLDRLKIALKRPGVTGVLGSPDILDDLLLMGTLDGKLVFGSMNRGGLQGASWTHDDRFTGYDAASIDAHRFEGGKMLLRMDPDDQRTAPTLEACAHAVTELAARKLIAMVEPFWSDTTPEGAMKAIGIASALGATSAYTWLKVPLVPKMKRVMRATTLPSLVLGGSGPANYEAWADALSLPNVIGLVVGRSLLYPEDEDVAGSVDAAAALVMNA